MVIEKDKILTENANLAHGYGPLSLNTFSAYVKNPPISKVFREIGFADELGSGMINTNKYTRIYSGGEPQFIEGDTFRIIIPLSEVATATVGPTVRTTSGEEINEEINGEINGEIKLTTTEQRILEEMKKNAHITRPELMESIGISKSTLDRAMSRLKKSNLLERVGSNKTGYWKINC
ncbi:MAG: winged helix-turn-helix transcriptional regulator [Clostridiales bacterium]|nr:winged helix-turn-helix transcriptional regulator [Clostridiales bacterium]